MYAFINKDIRTHIKQVISFRLDLGRLVLEAAVGLPGAAGAQREGAIGNI
jgi:hypothetical protein